MVPRPRGTIVPGRRGTIYLAGEGLYLVREGIYNWQERDYTWYERDNTYTWHGNTYPWGGGGGVGTIPVRRETTVPAGRGNTSHMRGTTVSLVREGIYTVPGKRGTIWQVRDYIYLAREVL